MFNMRQLLLKITNTNKPLRNNGTVKLTKLNGKLQTMLFAESF